MKRGILFVIMCSLISACNSIEFNNPSKFRVGDEVLFCKGENFFNQGKVKEIKGKDLIIIANSEEVTVSEWLTYSESDLNSGSSSIDPKNIRIGDIVFYQSDGYWYLGRLENIIEADKSMSFYPIIRTSSGRVSSKPIFVKPTKLSKPNQAVIEFFNQIHQKF